MKPPQQRKANRRRLATKNDPFEGFTRKYHVHTLVWYEVHGTMESAIHREKSLKAWKRLRKIQRIERANPEWRDLTPDIL
jgi:putative endonuclease